MIRQITDYKTLIFDCDGVVLDSNKVKTRAFYLATLPYGVDAANAMVKYHVHNGGVSRYKKFIFFIEKIVPANALDQVCDLASLLEAYASYVRDGLMKCDVAPCLENLRQKAPDTRWLIVSGGDEDELRDVFAQRKIAKLFDGGIFGSPDSKDEILKREIATGNIQNPGLFLGDSKYDFQVASSAGLDFLFLSEWTEVENWEKWVRKNRICQTNSIQTIVRNIY